MKTVILAGGYGMRLREETTFRPKPMVEVGGEPLLWHILKIYGTFGIHDFLICLGYKGEMIKEYFLNYDVRKSDICIDLGTRQREYLDVHHAEQDWRVALVDTGQSAMTGGRLLRIRHLVGQETFMMTYGDGVANINIAKLLECHQRAKRIATVTAVRPLSRFGELKVKGSMVTEFNEKPQVGSGWINGGFFVFEPELFRYLDGDDCILERSPLERLACEGQLAVYKHNGYWRCVDTQRDLEALNADWTSGNAPWKMWDIPSSTPVGHQRRRTKESLHVVE